MKGFHPDRRVEEWCKLLHITLNGNDKADFWQSSIVKRSSSEIRVIEQDVIRTRQEEEYFRSLSTINIMKNALISYCSFYSCEYMQGLNEIMAIIMSIDQISNNYQSNITNDHICFKIFEKFVEKLMPVIFSTKGVQALQIQLYHFHSLFCYHAPELWYLLEAEGMSIDIYATAWFVTLFSRRSPAGVVLHLWDLLLQADRPYLVLHIAVAFLMWNEKLIRSLNKEMLPETLVRLSFQTPQDVEEVFALALQLARCTPRSVVESMSRMGFDGTLPQAVRSETLSQLTESRTPFPIVSADDVAASLMGQRGALDEWMVAEDGEDCHAPAMMRFLLLDCRPIPSRRFFIESSVPLPPELAMELASVTHHQAQLQVAAVGLSRGQSQPLLQAVATALSPAASAALGLLWTCIGLDVHFAVMETDGSFNGFHTPVHTQSQTHSMHKPDDDDVFEPPMPSQSDPLSVSSSMPPRDGLPGSSPAKTQTLSHGGVTTGSRLAFALIRLGFPRICLVAGEGLPTAPSSLPPALQAAAPGLTSHRDGVAALAFRLWLRGSEVSPLGVLHVPEDAVLTHRARRFAEQMTAASQASARVGAKGTSKPLVSTLSNIYSNYLLSEPHQILHRVGETLSDSPLLAQVHGSLMGLAGGAGWGSHSGRKSSVKTDKDVSTEAVIQQMRSHGQTQSIDIGKNMLRSVQQSTMSLSTITDNMAMLQQRCSTLRCQLDVTARSLAKTKEALNYKMT